MKWIVSWIASLCIMSGGLYAMNYFNQQLAMKQERYEQSYGIFKTFQGAFYSIDEVIYSLPLTAATLLVVIGIIMMWDRSFLFVYMSLFLACFIFNWVGALLSIIGTMTFYTVWRNRT